MSTDRMRRVDEAMREVLEQTRWHESSRTRGGIRHRDRVETSPTFAMRACT